MSEELAEKKLTITRRALLRGAGVSAALLAAEPLLSKIAFAEPSAETPAGNSNGFTAFTQGMDISDDLKTNYLAMFYLNTPGNPGKGSPKSDPAYFGSDGRPDMGIYFYKPIQPGDAPNILVYDNINKKVAYERVNMFIFPGEGKTFLTRDDIKSLFGDPDIADQVDPADNSYLVQNYASKGFVIRTGNFGHDGAEYIVYVLEMFEPLPNPNDYLTKWGKINADTFKSAQELFPQAGTTNPQ